MASAAARAPLEQLPPRLGFGRKRRAREETVIGAVIGPPFDRDESAERIGDIGEARRIGADLGKPAAVVRDPRDPRGDPRPGAVRAGQQPLAHRGRDLVLAVMPGHLVGAEHREHGLRRKNAVEARDHLRAQRRADSAGLRRVRLQPPVMEHHPEFGVAQIEQRGGIPRHALLGQVLGVRMPLRPQPRAAIAQPEAHPVRGAEARMVAGGAGHLAVAGQDRVIEQQLPQRGLRRIEPRELPCPGRQGEEQRRQDRGAPGLTRGLPEPAPRCQTKRFTQFSRISCRPDFGCGSQPRASAAAAISSSGCASIASAPGSCQPP